MSDQKTVIVQMEKYNKEFGGATVRRRSNAGSSNCIKLPSPLGRKKNHPDSVITIQHRLLSLETLGSVAGNSHHSSNAQSQSVAVAAGDRAQKRFAKGLHETPATSPSAAGSGAEP